MAVAYGMPFHSRDVLGSYPSAQLAAVDRDTEIFKYGQIFKTNKNPNQRLVAARTLAGISPGYQEARIESLAGDNFSQRAFQEDQRANFALQKQYIKDRSEYMEQKTSNRLLRGSIVQALGRGGRSTGDRTPFDELDLDEQFDLAGGSGGGSRAGGSRASGSGRVSGISSPGSSGMPSEFQGLGSSFWGQEGGSQAGSQAGESERSFRSQEEEYGLGVEPINLNIDPARLQRIQAVRAVQSEERARMEVVGSLVGEMVGGVSGYLASEQEQERRDKLRGMLYETGLIYDVENPNDMTEEQLRTVARVREGQRKRGFFGRAEQASEETFMEQPLEIESAEMGMEPGGRSLQEMLGTSDEFGSRGSLALASGGGGAARPRGRPPGYSVSGESLAKRSQTLEAQKRWVEEQEAMGVQFEGGMRRKMSLAKTALASERMEGREAETALARSKGVQRLARRSGFFEAPKEEVKGFSLFD